ncbi:MAG: HesA/MoeB/ThiF family protein [Aminivibrio sp.]
MSWFDWVANYAETVGPWKTIPFREIGKAAVLEGVSPGEAEIYCLEKGYVPSRYLRNIGTIGIDGQIRLLSSKVAVIGCGGLGGLVCDLLARAGVGRLIMVDSDIFDETNLNRQLLATEKTLGRPKARVAAERAGEINSAVEVEGRQCRFDTFTAESILQEVDLAVDCLDSLSSRRVLFAECASRGIPIVSGAIAGFWGQVGVVLPGDDTFSGYLAGESDTGVETETGNPPFTAALVASLECAQALKLLTGRGRVLTEQLLWIDTADDEFTRLSLGPGKSPP